MILKGIELKNIRSHHHSKISFNNGITVLTGRTGSGKSSILMSIIYSLFGASVNLQNSNLLRRGAKNGFVRLVFNHEGSDYEVMRGMKRSGERILVNADELWVKKDGSKLPLIARSSELNTKLIELLGYPVDANPLDLFEVTSYAKQDEVRKLIELTPAERERYIDRVLGLSKYELTYKNSRFLINELNNQAATIKGRVERLSEVKAELSGKEEGVVELKEKIIVLRSELEQSEKSLSKVKEERIKVSEELNELQALKESYDNKQGLLDGLRVELKELSASLPQEVPTKCVLDELLESKARLIGNQERVKNKVGELNKEVSDVKSLKGDCPLCKQSIPQAHVTRVVAELTNRINSLKKDLEAMSDELKVIEERVKEERSIKELIELVRVKQARIKELTIKEQELSSELKGFKQVKDLSELKKSYETINNFFIEESNRHAALSQEFKDLSDNLISEEGDLVKLKGELKDLEGEAQDLRVLEKKVDLVTRLRGDIRSIRNVVRTRFLEDFRHEFQNKFEQLRPSAYSVEVGLDYEPLMFADGVKVSVDSLSGGERTSVALAYRLALSEIAAKLSSLNHNELLILDEPTTGFDQEDINSLPMALRNITIPQIIIVSHADELKDAADNIYELDKQENKTIIN